MQVLFNPHLGQLSDRPDTVHARINWYGCEGHLGGDFIKSNLEGQECLPLFKVCGTEEKQFIK